MIRRRRWSCSRAGDSGWGIEDSEGQLVFEVGLVVRAQSFELLSFEGLDFGGFADVDVGLAVGAFEEGGPEVVDGVTGGHREHAFVFEAAGRGEHLEVEGEEDVAYLVEAAGDV